MKITVHDLKDHKKELQIETEWSAIQADYKDILSKYLKFRVPGFRPGKAPKKIVAERFRKRIFDDLGTRCAQRFSLQVLNKEGFGATGHLSITDIEIEREKSFRFKVQCTVLPGFNLPDYTKFKLNAKRGAEKREELSEWLLNQTKIDVPNELVKQELAFDGDPNVQFNGDAWNKAFSRVKLLLVLRQIASQEGIEVEPRAVEKRVEAIATECIVATSDLQQQFLHNGGLSHIWESLLADKTLDYLVDICS